VVMADPRNSKIIGARLRVGAMAPSSAHPDPDLLTAFAEQSLNEGERVKVLEHLSQCTVCRDVVYFALPEEQAAPLEVVKAPIVKAPPQARWFAGRRLQWAALAASLSMIAAVAIFLKNNPERLATPGQVAHETSGTESEKDSRTVAAPPANTAPASAITDEIAGKTDNGGSKKTDNDLSRRETAALKSSESPEKSKASPGVAGEFGRGSFGALAGSRDDQAKAGRFSDKEAKQVPGAKNEQKDANGEALAFSAGNRLSEDNKRLFDLRQQQTTHGGPAANMNAMNNSGQNNTNLNYYDRNGNGYTANAPPPPAAPPSPSATGAAIGGPVSTGSPDSLQSFKVDQAESAKPAAQAALAKVAAPAPATRAVVPAEEARNRKKLETIPAQPTPQGTEETVAVAGQAQEVATNGTSAGLIDQNKTENLPISRNAISLKTLTPGVARTTAITGWRIYHGQVQARIYGLWHTIAVRTQQAFNHRSANPSSASTVSGGVVSANDSSTKVGSTTETVAVEMSPVVPPQRFSSVSAVGSDVWAAQAVGKGQAYVTVYHSHDDGVTWQPSLLAGTGLLKPEAHVTIAFKDAQQGEVDLSTGEKWQTSNGGAQWKFVK